MRKTVQSLIKLGERYKDIIDNILDVIVEVNIKGEFIYLSPQVYDVFGFRPEELIGLRTYQFIHPEDLSFFKKVMDNVFKFGDSLIEEYRVKHKSGYYIPISVKGSLVKENDTVKFIGILRDISERKKVDQKLRESEKKYRGIIENIMEGYFEADLKGYITFVNDYYCKMIGYKREELLGKNFRFFMDEKSSKEVYKLFNQLYRTKISIPHYIFLKVVTKSGKQLCLEGIVDLKYDSEGNEMGFFGLIRDVTERINAEQKLRESEHNLKKMIKELNCLYEISKFFEQPIKSVLDIITDTLNLIPPAWQFPEITCARIFFNNTEFKTNSFKETQWKLSASTKINKKEIKIDVYYLKNKLFLEEEKYLIKDIINRLKIVIEKKQAEENLQQFISIISHEFRTPLTVLVQSIDILKKYRDKISEEKKNDINDIFSRNVALLFDLVDNLLITSKIDENRIKLTWKEYQPLKLIHEIIELMESRRTLKEIAIDVDVDKDIRQYGDNRRISQIFRILIDNALKFSHEKSKIAITAIDHYKGKYNSKGNDGVIFIFKDFGIGISEEDRPQIFQRFFRAKNVEGIPGTGLGLSIAKDLINIHNGEIFIESEYGKGTSSFVFLPYLKEF